MKTKIGTAQKYFILYYHLTSSQCLSLVCLWIPLLHDGVVEILVSKEACSEHHGQTHSQHCTHHAKMIL